MAELDITNIVESITTKVTEDYNNFVFETIRPYCEEVTQQIVDKKTLSQALTKHFGMDARYNYNKLKCPNCNIVQPIHYQHYRGLCETYCYICGMKIVLRRK